jgi:hypothetical protein
MTVDQVFPIIQRVDAIAARVYPSSAVSGSNALVSPNIAVLDVVRPAGDVHVGNLEQTQGAGARFGWQRLRDALTGDGFTVTDCGCGVYAGGNCFVATAPPT